jgi:hypothetical protein
MLALQTLAALGVIFGLLGSLWVGARIIRWARKAWGDLATAGLLIYGDSFLGILRASIAVWVDGFERRDAHGSDAPPDDGRAYITASHHHDSVPPDSITSGGDYTP